MGHPIDFFVVRSTDKIYKKLSDPEVVILKIYYHARMTHSLSFHVDWMEKKITWIQSKIISIK
jgi:hypothetical protein